jgi:prefoldin subunit 5
VGAYGLGSHSLNQLFMDIQSIIVQKKEAIEKLNKQISEYSFKVKVLTAEIKKLEKILNQVNDIINANTQETK